MTTLVLCPAHTSLAALRDDLALRELVGQLRADAVDVCIELRLDRMNDATPASLRQFLLSTDPNNVIVTHRAYDEGGGRAGLTEQSIDGRLALFSTASTYGARFIDIERRTLLAHPKMQSLTRGAATKLVVSNHAFFTQPNHHELCQWRRQSEALGADHVKIAVHSTCASELLDGMALMQQKENWHRSLSYFGMGEIGLFSRLLQGRTIWPQALCYVAYNGAIAPGQASYKEALHLYDILAADLTTPVYAVLGNPATHSRSPHLHNAALRRARKKGIYIALTCRGDVAKFLPRAVEILGLRGLSVTLPYKGDAARLVGGATELVRVAQAANTLVSPAEGNRENLSRWYADNTDGPAAVALLQQALGRDRALSWPEQKILILGSGGAARTIAAGLLAKGSQLVFAARNPDKANALAASFGAKSITLVDTKALNAALQSCSALIHCTPVGMNPQEAECILTEADVALLRDDAVVFDTVYTPPSTILLQRARARNLSIIDGRMLLRAQGDLQAQAFYGLKSLAPPEA